MPSSILLETLRVARLQHKQLLQAQRPRDVVQPFGLLEHLLGLVLLGLALLIPLVLDELLALAALRLPFESSFFLFLAFGFQTSFFGVFGRLLLRHQSLLLLLPSLNDLLPLERGLVVPRRRGARHVEQSSA